MGRERSQGYEIYPGTPKDYNRDKDFYDDDSDIYESEFAHEHPYHEDGADYDLDYGRAHNHPYEHRNTHSYAVVLRPKENRGDFFREDD